MISNVKSHRVRLFHIHCVLYRIAHYRDYCGKHIHTYPIRTHIAISPRINLTDLIYKLWSVRGSEHIPQIRYSMGQILDIPTIEYWRGI